MSDYIVNPIKKVLSVRIYLLADWKGGSRPFGNFPKKNPYLGRQTSLNEACYSMVLSGTSWYIVLWSLSLKSNGCAKHRLRFIVCTKRGSPKPKSLYTKKARWCQKSTVLALHHGQQINTVCYVLWIRIPSCICISSEIFHRCVSAGMPSTLVCL